jgi:DeoR/GlpR family transcriptional regulator of sugar metabolism
LGVDEILNFLSDGRWHSVRSLVKRFNISEATVRKVLDFLADFDFIVQNLEENKVKVSEDYFSFIWSGG